MKRITIKITDDKGEISISKTDNQPPIIEYFQIIEHFQTPKWGEHIEDILLNCLHAIEERI